MNLCSRTVTSGASSPPLGALRVMLRSPVSVVDADVDVDVDVDAAIEPPLAPRLPDHRHQIVRPTPFETARLAAHRMTQRCS